MKEYNILITVALLTFFIFSCENVVDVDLEPHESLVSVYCMSGNFDPYFSVCLGDSRGINNESEPQFLAGADITIKKNGQIVNTTMSYNEGDGCYADLAGAKLDEAGAIYELEIQHPNHNTVIARQMLPSLPIIDFVDYEVVDNYDPIRGTNYDRLTVTFTDDETTEDYYHVHGYIRNQCCLTELYSLWTWSDNLLLGETVGSQGLIFKDKTFDDPEITLNLKLDNTYIEEETHYIYVRLSKITKDRYLYLQSKKNYYDSQGNPFAEPVTVHSNIEGGYGIFGLENTLMHFVE